MKYNLLFIDVGYRVPTYIHKMNVINGDHIDMEYSEGLSIIELIFKIVGLIRKDRPDKIIFHKDDFEFKRMFLDTVNKEFNDEFRIDAFGLIRYKGMDWSGIS